MKVKRLGNTSLEMEFNNGVQVLVSYNTPVAAFVPSRGYIRTSTKWSVTTSKHINKWLEGVNAQEVDQSELDGLMA